MKRTLVASYSRKDFRLDTFCSGGPGGQNQNKKQSGSRITHLPTGLVAESREHRHQHQNKAAAWKRLTELVRLHFQERVRPKPPISTEVVRTYHAVDNRVNDHASGEQCAFSQLSTKFDALIMARARSY